MMAKYNAEQLRTMAKNGQAMPDGAYPIADREDLGNAVHAVGRGGADHDAIRRHIMKRAKAMGAASMIPDHWQADGSIGDMMAGSGRAEESTPYTRSFDLTDISVRAGGDGRTVEAYAAIFDAPSAIRDQDGDYDEIIDPACFNRAIDRARRSKAGLGSVKVMYNHGMTMWSTPSERHSVPIGTPVDLVADQVGLRTTTRFHKTQLADEVLEAIREGSITAYSFSGRFDRSEPARRPGGRYRSGETVRRMESTLREFGPTPFPAYQDAAIVGVRTGQLGDLEQRVGRLEELLLRDTPDPGLATDDLPDDVGYSPRSIKQELMAQRARHIIRSGPHV
jgi:HK97 family phage prohead protease